MNFKSELKLNLLRHICLQHHLNAVLGCQIWLQSSTFIVLVAAGLIWAIPYCFSTPTPDPEDPQLPQILPFNLSNPSYLDFTHDGVFAIMDDYTNALPYSKLHSEVPDPSEPCECSGAVGRAATSLFGYAILALVLIQFVQ